MTIKEAIEYLNYLLESNYVDSFSDEENEALKMAIKALEMVRHITESQKEYENQQREIINASVRKESDTTFEFIIQKRGYGKKMREIITLADTIQGEINRMCVTDELLEFDSKYAHAKRNLETMHKIIYDWRFKVEKVGE